MEQQIKSDNNNPQQPANQPSTTLAAVLSAHKTFFSAAFIITLLIQFFLLGDMSLLPKCIVLIISAFIMVMLCATAYKTIVPNLSAKFSPASILYAVTTISALIILLLTIVFVLIF